MRAISAMISSSAAQDLLRKNSITPMLLPALIRGSRDAGGDAGVAFGLLPRRSLVPSGDIALTLGFCGSKRLAGKCRVP